MTYSTALAAVVSALSAETVSAYGSGGFEPRVQCDPLKGAITDKQSKLIDSCWVFSRLHEHLAPHHWRALLAKYSTHVDRKHAAIAELAKAIQSPAPERFRHAAVVTWAMPKLQGAEGKRSTHTLPASWYNVDNWSDEPTPARTQTRWKSSICKSLEAQVTDALQMAQELLDAEGLIESRAA
ncbi:MAG: hypothetical protein K2X80_08605 [Pseudomonadaceae bacterium]|nr:hypothetical protein [Pseudomonadaceae bacterium]